MAKQTSIVKKPAPSENTGSTKGTVRRPNDERPPRGRTDGRD